MLEQGSEKLEGKHSSFSRGMCEMEGTTVTAVQRCSTIGFPCAPSHFQQSSSSHILGGYRHTLPWHHPPHDSCSSFTPPCSPAPQGGLQHCGDAAGKEAACQQLAGGLDMRWLLGQGGQQEEVEDAEQGGLHSQVLRREEMERSQLLAAPRAAAPHAHSPERADAH